MKSNAKSSITLPAEELKTVEVLRKKLKLRTKVEVVRRGLRLLRQMTEREELRQAYREASLAVRKSMAQELQELDHLAGETME